LDTLAANDRNIEIIPSTTDLPTMLQQTDLVIAMGGYNTSVEIVASGKPAILVPRAAPREEQRLRAAVLARLGLVWSIEQGPDLNERLADCIEAAMADAAPTPPRCGLDLNGASRVGDLFDSITRTEAPALEAMN